jgi:hypothetical protein
MDIDKKRFGLGMGLAWVPILLVMGPGVVSTFRGISQEKATGLAAVAAGFMEFFVMFGFVAFVACEVAGIVILARGIRRERWGRSMAAVVSIAASLLILTSMVSMMWWFWHLQRS